MSGNSGALMHVFEFTFESGATGGPCRFLVSPLFVFGERQVQSEVVSLGADRVMDAATKTSG